MQKPQWPAGQESKEGQHAFYNAHIAELMNYLQGDSQILLKRSPRLECTATPVNSKPGV
ncbi:hypothetical protein ACFJGW_02475 [Burkholderiaceae bacterium UC74_6]